MMVRKIVTTVFLSTALLLTACGGSKTAKVAPAGVPAASLAFADPIAAPGHSEVVLDNTTGVALNIIIGGVHAGTVAPRSGERIVVADGNHTIQVQTSAGHVSRGVQFMANSNRTIFKATAHDATTFQVTRENIVSITPVQDGAVAGQVLPAASAGGNIDNMGTATGATTTMAASSRSGEDAQLFADRDRFFNRMDGVAPIEDPEMASLSAGGTAQIQQPQQPQQAQNMGTTTVTSVPAPAQNQAAAPAASANRAPRQVGVYVVGELNQGERRALGTQILVALVNSGQFIAVERSEEFLAQIDNEFDHQMSTAVDENEIRNIGRQFGVQYICVASVARAFNSYQVSARIIDIETAVVHAAAAFESPLANMNDLTNVSTRIARELVRRLGN